MSPTDKIDNLIKQLKTPASPELDQRIDALIAQSAKQPAQLQNTWSRIMKSNITRSAVAAIIVLGAFIFLTQSNGTGVVWADVVEQLNLHEKYKCRQRVVRSEGIQVPTKNIYHWNLSLRRQEGEDGNIQIIDMRDEDVITVELYPEQKKAVVTKLLGFGPRKDPDIIDMVKRFEQESAERLGTKKQDGKVLQGFHHQPNEHNDFTVWVDPKTKLPVEIELKHLRNGQLTQTLFMDEFEFDFQLDPSAFSTDVPEGYTVETLINDYRPTEPEAVSPEDIQKELNHAVYAIETLPWFEQIQTIKHTDPLGSKTLVFMTGIKTNDGNVIVIAQGNYYDLKRMVWIHQQELTLETPDGIQLFTHPNGSIYAKYFLESFVKSNPEFTFQTLSEERFTRMIVMPDGVVLSLSANGEMSNEQLQELVKSLVKIDSVD
jgi:outer membrane lipoprotein-sorting protein